LSKKRLFIAIPLPDTILAGLNQLQTNLKPFARDAKWVKPAGMHLTLKFLGYVDTEQVSSITAALKSTAKCHAETMVRAHGCGFFPNPRHPSVLWIGVEANLQSLQQMIEEEMSKLGFEKEKRPFSPHLTLARFRDARGLMHLAQETQKFANQTFGEFTATNIILYESILRPQGAEYHCLEAFHLKEQHHVS